MENAPSLAPRHAEAPQTIVITSKIIGPGGVQSDRKPQKSFKITFFALFGHFPSGTNTIEELLKFVRILAKGGPWAALRPDHCFSLGISRFLSSQNAQNLSEIVNFMKLHEIS